MATTDDLLQEGRIQAGRGDLAGAFRAFLRAAQTDPRGADAAASLLGQLAAAGHKARARRLLEAERIPGPLKKRLAGALKGREGTLPQTPVSELAALVRAGAHDKARTLSDRLLAENGDSAPILNLRGIIEIQGGEPEVAEGFLRRAVAADPAFQAAASNLGFALLLQDRAAEAAEILEAVVAAEPGNLDAATNLASARYRLEQLDEALDLTKEVIKKRPRDETARKIRAQSLWKTGRSRDALAVLRDLEGDVGARFDLWRISAGLIEEIEGSEAAIAYLEPWAKVEAAARMQRGVLMAVLGDLAGAEAEYRAMIEADPYETEVFYLLALQGDLSADDPAARRMIEMENEELPPTQASHLHYGLGKYHLDIGDTEKAFDHFNRANKAQSELIPSDYSWDQRVELLASIRSIWDADRISDYARFGNRDVAPIFIVGMPRSGSTLVEQILSAHAQVTGLGEYSMFHHEFRKVNTMSHEDFADVVQRVSTELVKISPTPRMVDKYLGNFRQLGAITAAFPNAIIINPRRDPRSIALSVFQNRFDPLTLSWTMNLENIAQYYLEYDRHMAYWESLLGDRIVNISYEDLVSDPETKVRWLIDRCKLDWDPACLRPELVARKVQTLSIGQVRRGINTSSRARWRKFEEELRPFTEILAAEGALPKE
jgi:tetratricopeptide (TPR) repeat protein